MRWSKGHTGSVSGYACCRSLRTLGQNINMSHRTLPRPARFTGFGLGVPQILYSAGLFFGTSVLLPFVRIYIMLFSRELFPSGILEKHRNPGYLRAVALLLWLLPREFVRGRIAWPTPRVSDSGSLGCGWQFVSNKFPDEAGLEPHFENSCIRVKKKMLFWNNYWQLELLILSKIENICFDNRHKAILMVISKAVLK